MANTVLSEHSRQFERLRFAYPVVSRRSRGLSLGLNVNPDKACNFDCPYCQVDRTVAPRDKAVDFAAMLAEVDELVALAASGEIWQHPRFSDTPAHLRRLNDIAFAGDGEPTTYARLGDAIREVHAIKLKHSLPAVKTIVLSNATLLGAPKVLAAMSGLKAGPYEIWAKLDAGTQGYFERISGTRLQLARIVDNIAACAREFEVTIQSLLPTLDGCEPAEAEVQALAERIAEIRNRGGNLRLVQVYTTARKPANPRVGMVEDKRLDQLAALLASRVDVPVEVYYGRHWD